MAVRIVIYDTSPLVISGLSCFLSQEGFSIVGSTTNPDELFHKIILLRPDFIIIDPISMRDDCLSRLCKLNKILIDLNIIIYASSDSVYHILRAYPLKWIAYLSKRQPLDALCKVLLQPEQRQPLLMDLEQAIPQDSVAAKNLSALRSLTGREMQVLRKIGAGKTNKMIADEMHLSNKTISTYKRNIMNKFRTNHMRDVVDIARRNGF
ncbi:response regulator transcription factor [Pantoea dispersa]|uniref:response regulator transcription factor n=1 Tax=Pantoea dispersa TaxID=59814 RepID=UPI002DBF732A|nr:response regulator transcription factor [Pantoea dispersa]MEB5974922.1 response regulator transcription factor [Pantoea dispersa]